MRRFQFRLRALLETARQRERSIQHELVRAQAIEANARMQLDTLIDTSAEWESRIRDSQRGPLNLSRLRDQLSALGALHQRIAQQRTTLRAAEKAVEEVRGRLTEAAQWRKSLERIRERTLEEHQDQYAMQQIKISDDMATTRAAAQMTGDTSAEQRTAMTGAQS